MAVKNDDAPLTAEWCPFAPSGPVACFHTACVINNIMYVHGGLKEKSSKMPSSELHRLNLNSKIWLKVHLILNEFCIIAIYIHNFSILLNCFL